MPCTALTLAHAPRCVPRSTARTLVLRGGSEWAWRNRSAIVAARSSKSVRSRVIIALELGHMATCRGFRQSQHAGAASSARDWRMPVQRLANLFSSSRRATSSSLCHGWCSPTTGVVERVLRDNSVDAAAGRGVDSLRPSRSFSWAVRAPCQALLLFSARDFEPSVPRFARRPAPQARPAPSARARRQRMLCSPLCRSVSLRVALPPRGLTLDRLSVATSLSRCMTILLRATFLPARSVFHVARVVPSAR